MINITESFTMDNELKSYIDKYDKFVEQQTAVNQTVQPISYQSVANKPGSINIPVKTQSSVSNPNLTKAKQITAKLKNDPNLSKLPDIAQLIQLIDTIN